MSDSTPSIPPLPQELALAPPPQPLPPEVLARNKRIEVRLYSGLIFTACASMLGLGAWMTPSPTGIGTHAIWLHLPQCGFYVATGYPCPTCGCTTAVTHLAHGHILQAIITQPFGALVGIVAFCLLPITAIGLIRGKWLGPSPFWLGWYWRSILFSLLTFMALSWIFKAGQMHNWWPWLHS